MTLPDHSSYEACKRERLAMAEDLAVAPWRSLTHEAALWLLTECDELERERESQRREAQHWHDEWLKLQPQAPKRDGDADRL